MRCRKLRNITCPESASFPTARISYRAFPGVSCFYTPRCDREQLKAFLTFLALPCDTFYPDFACSPRPKASCKEPSGQYDPETDVQFFADEPDAWVATTSGAFAIFFPADAHAPLISSGLLHKVVVKVAVNQGYNGDVLNLPFTMQPTEPTGALDEVFNIQEDIPQIKQFDRFTSGGSKPLMAMIEVTNRCNMACPICYSDARKSAEDVSFDNIRLYLLRLLEITGTPIPIQISGGEPSLRDGLPQIIALAKAIGYRNIELITNGIRIGKPRIPERAEKSWIDC